ncbi:MAG: hypothetical protein B7X50_08010 [Alishewanella sp. 34-51-39]|nr:MAG: hypothetical protein B7X50_08010 [Alishewanella sp. 34-51-39]
MSNIEALKAVFGAENVVVIDDDEQEAGLTGFSLVPEKKREQFYPSIVGGNLRTMLALEGYFYGILGDSCASYNGGYFDFVEFSNGAKAPILAMTEEAKVRVIGKQNWYEGMMTWRVLSLCAFALACNHLAHAERDPKARDALVNNWRLLMDVIYDHDFLDGERDEAIAFLD